VPQAKYISGYQDPRPYPVDSTSDFQVGDLVFCDAADGFAVKPAADFTWNSTLATTQTNFALRFAGVVMGTYTGTAFTGAPNELGLQTGEVMVAQAGVYEMDCAAAQFFPGTLVGPAKQSGNNIESQKVVQTSTEVTSIGRVYQKTGASATRVKFQIYPQLNQITTSAESGS
jgi:hypothetical protein